MGLSKRVPDDNAEDKYSLAPIIPEIKAQSTSYTFRSSTGLLNSTQFTQTSMMLVAMAFVADMQAEKLVQRDAAFAGHSMGEFCALAALGDIFSIESMLDITFYRGLIMQSAVPRDAQGRSEFGMAAVDPSRVGWAFTEDMLTLVVDKISAGSAGLLEIVNYNVRGYQYVAAGTLANLDVLRNVLDAIANSGLGSGNRGSDNLDDSSDLKSQIQSIVDEMLLRPVSTAAVRGKATIPLRGIDVPFHSRQLAEGVPEFREALRKVITVDTVTPELLCGRYVPNVTAVPFEVTRSYFEMVLDITGSNVAREMLNNWSD
ncbi:hypothetical protein COEREDRAFT_43350, partial [Coemansia reversa NRRL 1564]